jgi:hypothetical protein
VVKNISIFLTVLLLIGCVTTAQSDDYVYCELIEVQPLLGTKWRPRVDYGRAAPPKDRVKDSTLAPTSAKSKSRTTFSSMVEGLNYLNEQGWEFVREYTTSIDFGHELHWLFRRPVNTDDTEPTKSEASANEENKK